MKRLRLRAYWLYISNGVKMVWHINTYQLFCDVGFFVLVRSLSCAYSYENVTIIKRSILKSVSIIGVVAAVFDHPPSKYQQTGVV